MSVLAYPAMLLAQAANPLFEALSRAVKDGPSTSEFVGFWCGATALFLIVFLAGRYAARRDGPKVVAQVDYLTLLCDQLGLAERQRRDLVLIATKAGLAEPASLLLSPANFARAAAYACRSGETSELRERLDETSRQLFNVPMLLPRATAGRQERPARTAGT
jgi:hypothetical protein